MSKQPIYDPIDSPMSKLILSDWMHFYTSKHEHVREHVRKQHPRRDNEKEESYERALKARTFDIMRGFLPAGITTQLSWHTNLRQAGDHLVWLAQHPMDEVRTLARAARKCLSIRYPSSGMGMSLPQVSGVANDTNEQARLSWTDTAADEWSYSIDTSCFLDGLEQPVYTVFDFVVALPNRRLLSTRPRGCTLPHWMTDFGQAHMEFPLDFGSYRDLQRHRNGVVRMPLLTTEWGFEPWYLDQLDDDTRIDALQLITLQTDRIESMPGPTKVERQYLIALGYRVPCVVTMALPSLLYFLEMRTQKTVHPTLRARTLQIAQRFTEAWPDIALHADFDPDDWTVRRGEQTIRERT